MLNSSPIVRLKRWTASGLDEVARGAPRSGLKNYTDALKFPRRVRFDVHPGPDKRRKPLARSSLPGLSPFSARGERGYGMLSAIQELDAPNHSEGKQS